MRLALALALAACSSTAPPVVASKAPDLGPPSVELVAVESSQATFAATRADGKVAVTRTVALPFTYLHAHTWFEREVTVVGLDVDRRPHVGRITARGFEELPFPTAWPAPANRDLAEVLPQYALVASAAGELWLERCLGFIHLADQACLERAYTRLLPTPSPAQLAAPAARAAYRFAAPAPAPGMRVEIAGDKKSLRCTQAGRTETYPTEDDGDPALELTNVVWVAQDPPIFQVTRALSCNGICHMQLTFEGCAPSKRFHYAQLVAGPDGAYALHDVEGVAAVRWRGRELGLLDAPISQLSFAPR